MKNSKKSQAGDFQCAQNHARKEEEVQRLQQQVQVERGKWHNNYDRWQIAMAKSRMKEMLAEMRDSEEGEYDDSGERSDLESDPLLPRGDAAEPVDLRLQQAHLALQGGRDDQ